MYFSPYHEHSAMGENSLKVFVVYCMHLKDLKRSKVTFFFKLLWLVLSSNFLKSLYFVDDSTHTMLIILNIFNLLWAYKISSVGGHHKKWMLLSLSITVQKYAIWKKFRVVYTSSAMTKKLLQYISKVLTCTTLIAQFHFKTMIYEKSVPNVECDVKT